MTDAVNVAILTDVHGNAPALRAALDDIDKQCNIAQIYCLGDMIAIGPDTNEVLAMLFARNDVSMIIGNHEEAIFRVVDGLHPGSPGTEAIHHVWIAEHLDREHEMRLRILPKILEPIVAGHKLLLLHYHHDGDGKLLPVDHDPQVERLEAHYAKSDAAAVCFGHHHPRLHFQGQARHFVNPGALGCHDRPEARYAILTCSSDGVLVAMRDVPYDNRAFLDSYERLGVPAGEFILRLFHGNQHLTGILHAD